jgi:hypothetical protein
MQNGDNERATRSQAQALETSRTLQAEVKLGSSQILGTVCILDVAQHDAPLDIPLDKPKCTQSKGSPILRDFHLMAFTEIIRHASISLSSDEPTFKGDRASDDSHMNIHMAILVELIVMGHVTHLTIFRLNSLDLLAVGC